MRFADLEDPRVLGRFVASGASLTALHPDAGRLDLMTLIAGFSYSELWADATFFVISGVEVRVGQLQKLLRSKQACGRPKDPEILRAFEARASDLGDEGA